MVKEIVPFPLAVCDQADGRGSGRVVGSHATNNRMLDKLDEIFIVPLHVLFRDYLVNIVG